MKAVTTIIIAFLFGFIAASTFGTGPQGSVAVTVPQAVNTAITIGLVALVTAGTVWLFEHMGLDLRGYAEPLALTIAAFIVGQVQNIVNWVPAQYDMWLTIFFQALVVILGTVGLFRLRQPREASNNTLL